MFSEIRRPRTLLLVGLLHLLAPRFSEAQYLRATVTTFSTSSASFTDVPGGVIRFTPSVPSEIWVILMSGRLSSTWTASDEIAAEVHYLVNGTERGLISIRNHGVNPGGSFAHFDRVTGTTALQTVQVQLRDGKATATLSNLSVLAFRMPSGADFQFVDTIGVQSVPQLVWTSMRSLTFTPASGGNYLVMALASGRENPSASTSGVRLQDPAGGFWPVDDLPVDPRRGQFENGRSGWPPFFLARVSNLTATPKTYAIEAQGDVPGGEIRDTRIMAFRTDAFDNAESVEDLAMTTTTSTTPVVKSTLMTTGATASRDHIIIQSLGLDAAGSPTDQRRAGFERNDAVVGSYGLATTNSEFESSYVFFDAVTTASPMKLENTFSTSNAAYSVEGKESVIHVLRLAGASCCALATTEAAGTLTVTAPASFRLRFNGATGGGIDELYDLAEDPGAAVDLAGAGPGTFPKPLFAASLRVGGQFFNAAFDDAAKLEPLEVTSIRVKARQEARYVRAGVRLAGALDVTDVTVHSTGKALHARRRSTTTSILHTGEFLDLNGHVQSSGPLSTWTVESETDGSLPNAGTDDFLLAQNETLGARTDLLAILHKDWTIANGYTTSASASSTQTDLPNEWFNPAWDENVGTTIGAGSAETWNLLVQFKPTNFVDHLSAGVLERRDDFRGPDPLSISVGSGWNENTEDADFYNQSEAAYTLNADPAAGLTFDMDGSATSRFTPLFKIRQWRSLAGPSSVSLETAPLASGIDYGAEVKPVSRAHFANDLTWYSTLQSSVATSTPSVGTTSTVSGSIAFVPAKYGQGAEINANGDTISFAAAGNFDRSFGAVEVWYQPTYECQAAPGACDGLSHVLWHMQLVPTDFFILEKTTGNDLELRVRNGSTGITTTKRVALGAFGWRAFDWVHIRATWDTTGPVVADRLQLIVNEVVPTQSVIGGPFSGAGLTVGPSYLGTDSTGSNHASGILDEFHMFSTEFYARLAYGGLTANSDEYLADGTSNATLVSFPVDGSLRGQHLYFGSDSRFRGLNVALATAGTNVADDDIDWEYWNGTAWADLELVGGFTDQTNSFKRTGSIYWTSDPGGWDVYSVSGGPDLYYVRAHLKTTSPGYGVDPIEGLIKTDILLLQYCGDITAPAQTFTISPPIPTAVRLQSFSATPGDSLVDLQWTTASELRNLGFHLYRSLSPDGPGERITSSLMPGLGSSPQGASYFFRDSGLSNGTTYFYWLEDVETTGKSEQHGPVESTPTADAVFQPSEPPANGLVYGNPAATVFNEVERTARGVVLELVTSGFIATVEPDGSLRLSIPGFTLDTLPGAPAVPFKRSWLDVPSGLEVRVASVSASDVEGFELTRPRASGSAELVATRRGTVVAGERREREGNAFRVSGWYPSERARLVDAGYQGETQKALVELAPLQWDRTSGRWRLARKLTVRLAFTEAPGASPQRRHRESRSHSAAGRRWQLVTREKGLQGVSFGQLLGRGGRALSTSTMELSRLGERVAYHVEPDPGRFGPGSVLYFVSGGPEENPYGNEAVYELSTGRPGIRMPQASASPAGPPVGFYWETLEREEDRYYQAGLLEAEDLWLWDVLLAPVTKTFSFSVRDLEAGFAPSRLVIRVQGTTDFPESPDHHVRAWVNGSLVAESRFDGKRGEVLTAELLPSVLREGDNELQLENVGDTGAAYSMVMLDRFAVSYPRSLSAASGTLEGRMSESGVADIEGPSSDAIALDVSGDTALWLEGAEASANGLRLRVESGRSYLVVRPDAVRKPEVRNVAASSLRSGGNRADYVVLGPRDLLRAAQPLLDLRRRQGLVVRAVDVEEVYRTFGFGESRPEALQEFLAYAYHHWRKPAPRYVLLLGDATYDFKDHLATGIRNQVPPLLVKTSYLWTASDPSLAMVNGEDGLPDLAIGRLPAKSSTELTRMLRKILAYEARPDSGRGVAVLVADNPDSAGNFEADAEELASSFLPGRTVKKIFLGQMGTEATREAVVEAFDAGASLVSYMGHGGIHLWAEENVLESSGVSSLAPQPQQPILLTLNCLNGYFHFPYFDSLAEELLKAEGKGALAAISPSGLSLNDPAHLFHKAILTELHSGRHLRLGDALAAAQETYAASGAFPELLRIYHLLGDPALTIR